MNTTFSLPARRIAGGALAAALAAALANVGSVAARTLVDPATLNPPPPVEFNAACYSGAGGTICELAFSDEPVVDEPTEIFCDGSELLSSWDRSVVGKRYYDADDNLVQRHFREWLVGTLSNPATGRTVAWEQHDTVIHDLAVPGDLGTGTLSTSGLQDRIYLPGGASLLVDTGTTLESLDDETVLRDAGPNPIGDYFEGEAGAIQKLCDALG